MTAQKQTVTLLRARAGSGPSLYLSSAFDQDIREQDMYYPRSRIYQYVRSNNSWASFDLAQYVLGMCTMMTSDNDIEVLFTLSLEGEVIIKRSTLLSTEQIFGAGLYNSQADHRGRMFDLQEIGKHLYACGEGGQLYRRDASGQWQLLDAALLPDRITRKEARDTWEAAAGDDWSKLLAPNPNEKRYAQEDRLKSFQSINGPSEQEVYATAYDGALLLWNGGRSRFLEGIPKVNLFGILVQDHQTVWICGSQGTLLRGNYRDGFTDVSPGGELSFNSLALFMGKLYLTANGGFGGEVGLFTYDNGTLERVQTGLMPEILDVNRVDAADGMLWAVGLKDIVCFDGQRWHRIDHPDNPPVR